MLLSVAEQHIDEHTVQLTFAVIDTGIGISEQNQSKLFEVFTQEDSSTTRHYGGSGLDYQSVENLAQMMGGDIVVKVKKMQAVVLQRQFQLKLSARKAIK